MHHRCINSNQTDNGEIHLLLTEISLKSILGSMMMIRTNFLIYFLVILQLNSNFVLSQRTFANPAVIDPAPCACDLRANTCDPNCCCDPSCTDSDLSVSPICNSTRTVSSYSSSQERNLQTWNCSNSTSSAMYDYFPFVCVQLKFNEVIGQFYPTDNITFLAEGDDPTDLRAAFVTEYPELFEAAILTPTGATGGYIIGAPVQTQSGLFTLPGNLVGSICQDNVNVLFGVNQDVSCTSSTSTNLCSTVTSVTSFWRDGSLGTNVSSSFFTKSYTPPPNNTRNPTTEYYFQDSYNPTIDNISFSSGSINDYCPYRHPLTRTQRYGTVCNSSSECINNQYQTWSGCPLRDNFAYTAIPQDFFSARPSSIDDPTNFADFDNATNTTGITCTNIDIRRVFYRFNYSSIDNTISTVEVFVLTQVSGAATFNPRITIEWNDIAVNPASNTTIPLSYLDGEVLQFRNNGNPSDASTLVPTSNGYCIDATRTTLRYKQSTSSYCFIQLTQATVQQCHNLKLNMYIYLNVFYVPASDVLTYPNPSASPDLVPIRDTNQDSLDLDQIDETRPNNRLNQSYIIQTELNISTPTIYDATDALSACYNVPSGIYIEFGFVRVAVSPTISFERIVSVRYNYTYSNWQFDCTEATCASTSTQKYLVTFQSAFVDYTNVALNMTDVTSSDLTSADNYIQHLLWLITPEYKGEPGYRNYTIAMILIFIAISIVVIHVLLFGIMCPF